jgi:hypothetical protein
VSIAFLVALALYFLFPASEVAELAFLTLSIFIMPIAVLHFGGTLYTAVKSGYVVPNDVEGPAYRSDKPVTFFSNVILSAVFVPMIIGGSILLAGEAVRLAARLF